MRYELNPEGWIWWPEREDLSLEFMRLLAAAQDGGSTVSECWLTAARVDFADDESWHREWTRAAEVSRARAVAAAAGGNRVTARSNWLRAINYYQAAAYPFELAPDRQQAAVAAMRECAANYLQHREPRGEVVSISWLEEFPLQGYFLPARPTGEPAPVVISIGEPGHRKEEFLFKLFPEFDRVLRRSGLAILSGILHEQGEEIRRLIQEHRYKIFEEITQGEWLTLIVAKHVA